MSSPRKSARHVAITLEAGLSARGQADRQCAGYSGGGESDVGVNFWNARNNLRNGNPCGDPSRAPRCGARARTRGRGPCLAPAVRGSTRCRMHGGLSTEPRTAQGLERSRRARRTHGRYSRAARSSAARRPRPSSRPADVAVSAKRFTLYTPEEVDGPHWRKMSALQRDQPSQRCDKCCDGNTSQHGRLRGKYRIDNPEPETTQSRMY